jgi:sigma-B regulation protein RsbU (phosphoserine phosphatase)
VTAASGQAAALTRDELGLLADFSEAIAVSLDIETTLREAVQRIAEHMGAEAAALFLVEGDQVICRGSHGAVDIRGLALPRGRGIVGRTLRENRIQLVPDVQADPDFAGNLVGGFIARSMVCAPLSTRDGPIGAMQLLNRIGGGTFDEHDADFLRLLAGPTALALNNARLVGELLEQNRIKREFELARQMQRELQPARQRGFPVHGVNLPAREVSGDFYDYFELPDGRIGFFIGDVSGKGMDAAMLMIRAHALLRLVGQDRPSPAAWLSRVNRELTGSVGRGLFVCVLAGTYDPCTSILHFASAGIPPALERHDDGRSCTHAAGGPPLGIIAEAAFEEARFPLAGGAFYAFTDGLTDIRDAQGAVIGLDGARRLIESVQALSPRARLRGLIGRLRHQPLPDDTTLLMVADTDSTPRLLAGLSLHTDPCNLRLLRQTVCEVLGQFGCPASLRQRLVLALDEAAANVIRHAYAGDPNGRMTLTVHLEGMALVFRIRDWAPRVDCDRIKPRNLDEMRPGGLGINLIDLVMDDWAFGVPDDGCGNLWTARKGLQWEDA